VRDLRDDLIKKGLRRYREIPSSDRAFLI